MPCVGLWALQSPPVLDADFLRDSLGSPLVVLAGVHATCSKRIAAGRGAWHNIIERSIRGSSPRN